MPIDIVIRQATEEDLVFVRSSWKATFLKSWVGKELGRNGPELKVYAYLLEKDAPTPNLYYYLQDKLITHILKTSEVRVAAWKEDPQVIVGWICFEYGTLHYAVVKKDYQGEGVFRRLLETTFTPGQHIIFTHWPDTWDDTKAPSGFYWGYERMRAFTQLYG